MDDAERERRSNELADEIRRRQHEMGHEGPTPAFLSLLMDKTIDTEWRLEQIEARLAALEETHG